MNICMYRVAAVARTTSAAQEPKRRHRLRFCTLSAGSCCSKEHSCPVQPMVVQHRTCVQTTAKSQTNTRKLSCLLSFLLFCQAQGPHQEPHIPHVELVGGAHNASAAAAAALITCSRNTCEQTSHVSKGTAMTSACLCVADARGSTKQFDMQARAPALCKGQTLLLLIAQ